MGGRMLFLKWIELSMVKDVLTVEEVHESVIHVHNFLIDFLNVWRQWDWPIIGDLKGRCLFKDRHNFTDLQGLWENIYIYILISNDRFIKNDIGWQISFLRSLRILTGRLLGPEDFVFEILVRIFEVHWKPLWVGGTFSLIESAIYRCKTVSYTHLTLPTICSV